MTREELCQWVQRQYGVQPEYPWKDENGVLRHEENRKWFAVILRVAGDRIGLLSDEPVDVVNVKSDPALIGVLRTRDGFFPAYHMNKEKWISIRLGDPGLDEEIRSLLDMSYQLTAPKRRKEKIGVVPAVFKIRGIIETDDAQISEIIRANLRAYHLDIPGTAYFDPELDHLSAYYRGGPDKRAYFVAEDRRGKVIGGAGIAACSGIEDCGEIQKLYLTEEAKGKGIGKALLLHAARQAEQMGYKHLYLETHTNLQEAIHLYEKMGFQKIERPDFVIHSTMDCFYYLERNSL